MSNQKHTVSTDALDTLGTCPIPENSGRDAIHLAVEPVVAGHMLKPGQRVFIANGCAFADFNIDPNVRATGIVDPFLERPILAGEKFWFVVLPRTITSLRHVWSHPAFPEAESVVDTDPHYVFNPEQSMAMAWMKDYCRELGERYEYIMDGAKKFIESGDYLYGEKDRGNLEGVNFHPQEFWDKYEAITGEKVGGHTRGEGSFFSCSC